MTDGGWQSMADVARLYGKSWKWVQNQVKKHNISTEKRGNQRVLRLVDFITHMGEPPTNGKNESDGSHNDQSETLTTDEQLGTALLKQENEFLRKLIEELEADKADWKVERSRLQSIIERHTYALPQASDRGVLARLVQWVQGHNPSVEEQQHRT